MLASKQKVSKLATYIGPAIISVREKSTKKFSEASRNNANTSDLPRDSLILINRLLKNETSPVLQAVESSVDVIPGNSFFEAVVTTTDYSNSYELFNPEITAVLKDLTGKLLRSSAVKYLQLNQKNKVSSQSPLLFESLVSTAQKDFKKRKLGHTFEDYISIMSKPTTWADDTIILATASYLGAEIKICCHSDDQQISNWQRVLPEVNSSAKLPTIVLGQLLQKNHFVGTTQLFVDENLYW
jgi:hypothetical protein